MARPPCKLQLEKGFFTDLSQIARVLTYAVKHQDEGYIPPEAYVETVGVAASRVENLSSLMRSSKSSALDRRWRCGSGCGMSCTSWTRSMRGCLLGLSKG
jgi:hypothetical protein